MNDDTCCRCLYGIYKDVGYSDLTVEGTNFHCRKGLRPVVSAEPYEEIPKPEDCHRYAKGRPQHLSVEDEMPDDVVSYSTGYY